MAEKGSFENSFQELENTVEKLRNEEITLEESIKLYEDGINHFNQCEKILSEAKQRIETIERERD